MPHSSDIYVDVNLSTTGTGVSAANFGGLMGAFTHSVTANRLDGPYSSLTAVESAGFTAAAAAKVHAWAQAVFAQESKPSSIYIGRILSADADLSASLSAIDAADPGKWVYFTVEDRTAAEIKLAFAWAETRVKFFVGQSNDASLLSGAGPEYTLTFAGTPTDGDYTSTFAGFGLAASVTVTTARSTTPATNADLATQHALDIAGTSGLSAVVVSATAVNDTVVVVLANDLASGTLTHSAPSPGTLASSNTDDDLASDLKNSSYTHGMLVYHDDDTEYLDAAYASAFGSFDLDSRKGTASFLKITGISAAGATDAQIAALRDTNTNYYAIASSSAGAVTRGFTAPGTTPEGRYADLTLSIFLAQARLEEALLDALLRSPEGIPFDDNGIGRFRAIVERVFSDLGNAQHIDVGRIVPDGEDNAGETTPLVIMPTQASLSSATLSSRTLTFSAVFYFKQFVEKVVFNVNARL